MSLKNYMQEELEKSPILKALICASSEYIMIFDESGKIEYLNGKMKGFLKENPKISFSNIDTEENFCEIDLEGNKGNLEEISNYCTPKHTLDDVTKNESTISNKEGFLKIILDGKPKKISIIINIYSFIYNEQEYTIFSFRDIETIKQIERKRIADLKKLSTIGESVAAIVHDLKNPLTGLIGYLELLKIKENKEDFIPKMEGALERIRTTLEDILCLTGEEEELILDREFEDIREIVVDVVRLLNIEEITHIDIKGKSVVYIDRNKFHNVIWNLVKNANESLNDEDEEADEIEIKVYKSLKNLIIEIKDNGKGIPDEHKNQLFKAGKTFGKHNGTGFGLVNVKKIVEAHGGTIDFESEIGLGTKFFIKIPING